jgi:ATP-dependent RNA helicase RhlE
LTDSTFAALGVAGPISRALAAENYTVPTPIQHQVIPAALSGRDILGIAQTGTGKTAAFCLPLLQHLNGARVAAGPNRARALILAPTRELVVQIQESLRRYGRHLSLRYTTVLGGVNQQKQVGAMRRGTDVLVATPGRLLDLIKQKHIRLDAVATLVIDEADRMFDMGFIGDVRKIVSWLPRQRQSMLFSATMPAEVMHLVGEVLHDPLRVNVSPKEITAERVEQFVHFVAAEDKRGLLLELLRDEQMKRVIVFTRTKHGADKVVKHLAKAGHATDALHGGKSQNARQRALQDFRSGKARILVATDIAARGIDVDQISHVVNFELPHEAESYVHRIGRTARAGNGGVAISFCDSSERGHLRGIERLVKRPLKIAGGEDGAPESNPANEHAKGRPKRRVPNRKRARNRRDVRQAA